AGQVSLGHAGFIAAGAFTTAMLVENHLPSPLLAPPAAALVGALLGVIVGIPALRLKGLYLSLGTLALHHVVLYACGEFQNHWGASGSWPAAGYCALASVGVLGSALGAVFAAAFVTLLPYGIDAGVAALRVPGGAEYYLFPLKFGAFALLMAAFLIFEPQGLVGVWRRVRNWVFLWPLRYRPLRSAS